jgi:hypothetical protein
MKDTWIRFSNIQRNNDRGLATVEVEIRREKAIASRTYLSVYLYAFHWKLESRDTRYTEK